MPGLHELQQRFGANLLSADAAGIHGAIMPGGFAPDKRLQVYRNNVFTGLTEALRAVFPVIERLVGPEFFEYAAGDYIKRFPSTSGNLHDFGAAFASFLASYEPAAGLPYLHDVACLEWHYHEVYHEADADTLELAVLGAIDPDRFVDLRFVLNPACRLLQSAFPVLEIWRVNQPDYASDPAVDLDSGGVNLLLLRTGEEVEIHPLPAADYGMLLQLYRGQTLDAATSGALALDPGFDLQRFLLQFIANGTLVKFSTSAPDPVTEVRS